MRVLLIDPKSFGKGLSVGLGYLSACLISNGHEVNVIDLNNKEENEKKRLAIGLFWEPDIVGISITTFSLKEAQKVIRFCRKRYREAFYVAGGPHVTLEREEFLRQNSDLFDCCIIGEGELTMLDLISNIQLKNDLSEVKGIVYHKNRDVISTRERPFIKDLDNLPFPNYRVFDSVSGKLEEYPIITSRGCPFDCVFCANKYLSKRKWRRRSPKNVIEEIKHAMELYRFKKLVVWDDNFTLDVTRAKEICDLIISEGFHLNYSLNNGIRADRVDKELIKKLKASGCTEIYIGIENGDPETFPLVNKGETLEEIEAAVSLIKEEGMKVEGFMIIGLIDTTYQSTITSIEFIDKLGISAHWYIAIPFPYTKLYEWVKENGHVLVNVKEGLSSSMWSYPPPVTFENSNFTKEERLKAYVVSNLRSGNYGFLFESGKSSLHNAFNVMVLTWVHDKGRLPKVLKDFIYGLARSVYKKLKDYEKSGEQS